jgi:hypothetical protein
MQYFLQDVRSMSLGELRRAAYHFGACLRAAGYRPGMSLIFLNTLHALLWTAVYMAWIHSIA